MQALSLLGLNSDEKRKKYLGAPINVTEDRARQSINDIETAILAIEKEIDTKFKTCA